MTGLIFGTIIAAWAAVLVPMWLRRHDDHHDARSVERFSSTMRVLARRDGTTGMRRTRSVGKPALADAGDGNGTGPRMTGRTASRPHSSSAAAARRPGPSRLARRRRRTLLVLVLLVLLTAGLSGVGVAPVWSVAPAVLLLAGFLVHLRVQARVAHQAARRRSAAARRAAAREERRRTADRMRRAPRPGAVAGVDGEVVDGTVASEELEWEPREVPLPTYVTKPVAPRAPENPLVRHPAPAPEDVIDEALDDELGAVLERRRVVGE